MRQISGGLRRFVLRGETAIAAYVPNGTQSIAC